MDFRDDSSVAVVRERACYSTLVPFDPSESYPEWPNARTCPEDNPAFRGVRALLAGLGLDHEHFGSESWNPLREMIHPGSTVVLKPNLVADRNAGIDDRAGFECLVTHGSVIRVVLDYISKALVGEGTIVIADCPLQGTDWDALTHRLSLPLILADCRVR